MRAGLAIAALVLAAASVGVLAGCGIDNGCCPTCSHPAGACGDPLPTRSASFVVSDGGVGDATSSGLDSGDAGEQATSDAGGEATAVVCPTNFQSVSVCAPALGATCVHDDPTLGCALDALPSGLACTGSAQCALTILPCPDEVQTWGGLGRVDGYVCTCVGSRWSCDDCDHGQSLCADGGSQVEASDAGDGSD